MQSTAIVARPVAAAFDTEGDRRPPLWPRIRRLSGRPSCRIYLGRRAWMLEFESVCGGWMEPSVSNRRNRLEQKKALAFPTLAEAVGYAERHGYDYRIDPPMRTPSSQRRPGRNRLPRSWLARLAGNGRSDDLYQG